MSVDGGLLPARTLAPADARRQSGRDVVNCAARALRVTWIHGFVDGTGAALLPLVRAAVVALSLLALAPTSEARSAHGERRDLALTLIVLGGLASAAGTAVAIEWDRQVWQQFGCELGNGIPALFGGMPGNEACGRVDGALIPTGATLVGVGQVAVIAGSVLLRF